MGIEEEKLEQIIEEHVGSIDALKSQRDEYKEKADKYDAVKKQYDDLKKEVEEKGEDSYKEKYEKEHKDFEDYKASIDAEKLNTKKVAAYKALLKKAGINEKTIKLIVKGTSMDDIELDDKDEIKEADKKMESIKEEYADYIPETREEGEDPETPPGGKGGSGAKNISRAAQLAQKHNERLYGVKGDNK